MGSLIFLIERKSTPLQHIGWIENYLKEQYLERSKKINKLSLLKYCWEINCQYKVSPSQEIYQKYFSNFELKQIEFLIFYIFEILNNQIYALLII